MYILICFRCSCIYIHMHVNTHALYIIIHVKDVLKFMKTCVMKKLWISKILASTQTCLLLPFVHQSFEVPWCLYTQSEKTADIGIPQNSACALQAIALSNPSPSQPLTCFLSQRFTWCSLGFHIYRLLHSELFFTLLE